MNTHKRAFWLMLPLLAAPGCATEADDQSPSGTGDAGVTSGVGLTGGTRAVGGSPTGGSGREPEGGVAWSGAGGTSRAGGASIDDVSSAGGSSSAVAGGAGGAASSAGVAGRFGAPGGGGAGGHGAVGTGGVGGHGPVGTGGHANGNDGSMGAGGHGPISGTGGAGGHTSVSSGGNASGGGASSGQGGGSGGSVKLPPANAKFDYQIGGAYGPPSGVQIVSRDRNDAPAPGIYNICYINGFQIQPGEESWWQSNHPDLILRDAGGTPVVDTGWDETLVDTSTSAKRTELASVIGAWITQCATDGYDAVEIDNLDSYSRSGGLLTQANNIAFMALLSQVAHASGLAVGQKNSTELLASKSQMGTDFAIAEECNHYDECGDYKEAYGDLVFVIEYDRTSFTKGCSKYPELSIVLRDVNVTPNGTYDAC